MDDLNSMPPATTSGQHRRRLRRTRLALPLALSAVLLTGALVGCSSTPTQGSNCAAISGVVDAIQPIVDEQLDQETFQAYDASLKKLLAVAKPSVTDPALRPLLDELEKIDPGAVDPELAQVQYRSIVAQIAKHCPDS